MILFCLQVNGKLLCLLCTISFKRIQHRQKKASKRKHTDSSAKEKNGTKEAKVSKTAPSSDERSTPVADNPLKQFYTSQPRYISCHILLTSGDTVVLTFRHYGCYSR